MDFKSASEKLGRRDSRKLENNTYLKRRSPETIAVQLHATDIITFHPEHTVLSSGGWQTVTTKDRLNKYMPSGYGIWQVRGIWQLMRGGPDGGHIANFSDGISIHNDGRIRGGLPLGDKTTQAIRKSVDKFAEGYVKALLDGKVPEPSNGDCFYCQMRNKETNDPMTSHECISAHISEHYYFGSLIINAMDSLGAPKALYWSLGKIWRAEKYSHTPFDGQYSSRLFKKYLKKYCLRKLGMVA